MERQDAGKTGKRLCVSATWRWNLGMISAKALSTADGRERLAVLAGELVNTFDRPVHARKLPILLTDAFTTPSPTPIPSREAAANNANRHAGMLSRVFTA